MSIENDNVGKECPICGYIRQENEPVPANRCPKCRTLYPKKNTSTDIDENDASSINTSSIVDAQSASKIEKTYTKKQLGIVAVVFVVIGFFAGREYMKYEIRQALSGAFSGIAKSFNDEVSHTPVSAPSNTKTFSTPTLISASLIDKGFASKDYSNNKYSSEITIQVAFTNITDRDIRAFDGVLTFTDLLDNKIMASKLSINEPVAAHSTLSWSGQIEYNQFLTDHKALRTARLENVKIGLQIHKVLYSDGTTQSFE